MLLCHAPLIGTQEDPVVSPKGHQGEAVLPWEAAAAAGVDAQPGQNLLVVGGHLVAAKFSQVGRLGLVHPGIGAGVYALPAGVHLAAGKVFVANVIANGKDSDLFHSDTSLEPI